MKEILISYSSNAFEHEEICTKVKRGQRNAAQKME